MLGTIKIALGILFLCINCFTLLRSQSVFDEGCFTYYQYFYHKCKDKHINRTGRILLYIAITPFTILQLITLSLLFLIALVAVGAESALDVISNIFKEK